LINTFIFNLEGSGNDSVSKAAKGGRKGNSAVTGKDGGGAKDPDESYSYDDDDDEEVRNSG